MELVQLDLPAIREAIRIADLCAEAESRTPQEFRLADIESYRNNPAVLEAEKLDREFIKYLNSLNYATVLDLEALMQIGREHTYNFDCEEEDPVTIEDPETYFCDCRDYFADMYPNENGKDLAIEYLVGKGCLAQYWKNAFKVLGLPLKPTINDLISAASAKVSAQPNTKKSNNNNGQRERELER